MSIPTLPGLMMLSNATTPPMHRPYPCLDQRLVRLELREETLAGEDAHRNAHAAGRVYVEQVLAVLMDYWRVFRRRHA